MDKESMEKSSKSGPKKKKREHSHKDPSSNDAPHKEKESTRDKSESGIKSRKIAEGKHVKKSMGHHGQDSELDMKDEKTPHHGHKGDETGGHKNSVRAEGSSFVTLHPVSNNVPETESDAQRSAAELLEEFLNIAEDICDERFYGEHGSILVSLQLRDTWLRIIEMEWLDVDMKRRSNNESLPNAIFMPDLPPKPLKCDSWSRGGLEEFPNEKRESVLDPFLRDYSEIPYPRGSSLLSFQEGSETSWIDGNGLLKIEEFESKLLDEAEESHETSKTISKPKKVETRKTPVKGKVPSKPGSRAKSKNIFKTNPKSPRSVSKSRKKFNPTKSRIPILSPSSNQKGTSLGVKVEDNDSQLEEEKHTSAIILGNNAEDDLGLDQKASQLQVDESGVDGDGEMTLTDFTKGVDKEEGDNQVLEELFPPPYPADMSNSTTDVVLNPLKNIPKEFEIILPPRRLESKSSEDIGQLYYKALGLKPWTLEDCGAWTGNGYGVFRLPRQTTIEALRLTKIKSMASAGRSSVDGNNALDDQQIMENLGLNRLSDDANRSEKDNNEPRVSTATAARKPSRLEFFSDSRAEFIRQSYAKSRPSLPKASVKKISQNQIRIEKEFVDRKMQLYRRKLQLQRQQLDSRNGYLPSSEAFFEEDEALPPPAAPPTANDSIASVIEIPSLNNPSSKQFNNRKDNVGKAGEPVPKEGKLLDIHENSNSLVSIPLVHDTGSRKSDPLNFDPRKKTSNPNLGIQMSLASKVEKRVLSRLAAKGVILPDFQIYKFAVPLSEVRKSGEMPYIIQKGNGK